MSDSSEGGGGTPAWMVSFGDMMTLILTFFILLVSMAEEQKVGLTAQGIGSFVMALESHGLLGLMSDSAKLRISHRIRQRFDLPPEDDPERRADPDDAVDLELLRAEALDALLPHDELQQPAIATFAPGSAALTDETRAYLDRLAPTLQPLRDQILALDGHAADRGTGSLADPHWLAYARAAAVRSYLIEVHGFKPQRVEARAWVRESHKPDVQTRSVDARLITPSTAREDDR